MSVLNSYRTARRADRSSARCGFRSISGTRHSREWRRRPRSFGNRAGRSTCRPGHLVPNLTPRAWAPAPRTGDYCVLESELMYRLLRHPIAIAALASLVANPTAAQGRDSEAAVVNAVLSFRFHWLGDDTPFDKRQLTDVLGGSDNILDLIDPAFHRLLASCPNVCTREDGTVMNDGRIKKAHLRSISVEDSTAQVTLSTVYIEYYSEVVYDLVRANNRRWRVRTATVKPTMQIHPARPRDTRN